MHVFSLERNETGDAEAQIARGADGAGEMQRNRARVPPAFGGLEGERPRFGRVCDNGIAQRRPPQSLSDRPAPAPDREVSVAGA